MEECDYENVEKLVAEGDYEGAQSELAKVDERNAKWHFLQSKVFYEKGWIYESKKQMEIAVELEPNNAQYIEEMEKLNALGETAPQSEKQENVQMGKKSRCRDDCAEACCLGCGECLCTGICEAICNGCGG